jgi:hypothetical protein
MPALLLLPRSPPPNLACRCHPQLLSAAVTVVVVRRCRCRPPPSLLSSSAAIVFHRCHLLPPQPSLPLRVSTVSCRSLLSVHSVVRRPILHAIVARCCSCPPLPSSPTAAIFCRHSHHHHSTVSAISHLPLLSFPITVRHPIMRVFVHPPQLLSAIAVPPLVLPPTRC